MIIKNKVIQGIAKIVMNELLKCIKVGMKEYEIVELAEELLRKNGINSFWYYNIGAFVFVGERTTISISGREYKPSNEEVKYNDIITIDLSPEKNNIWGDYARTIIVEKGKAVGFKSDLLEGINSEFKEGIKIEEELHKHLLETINKEMTFEDLYHLLNNKIDMLGYENLDFAGNLGHSIEIKKENRKYIEKRNKMKLSQVNLFTFEPHIRKKEGKYGYKLENIYYFENDTLKEL